MAWTQTDLDTIEAAIASAELSVRFSDGREVVYRSMSDLLKARDVIRQSVSGQGVRCTYAQFTKD